MQNSLRIRRLRPSAVLLLAVFIGSSICFLLLGIVSASAWTSPPRAWAQAASANYDESKAGNFTFPDPLVFSDGKPVKTARDWRQRRRAELLQLFETNVYGRGPKPPKPIRYEVFDSGQEALGGKAVRKQVAIYIPTPHGDVQEDLLMYTPAGAFQRVPVILEINFAGNQSVADDPAVKVTKVWSENPRTQPQAPIVEKFMARGYGFATFCYQDIEPDFKDGYKQGGIRRQFFRPGQTEPGPDDHKR